MRAATRAASRAAIALALLAPWAPPARGAVVNWLSDVNGNWNLPANWSSNPALPNANDDVIISRPTADPLVSILSNFFSVKTLVLDDRLLIMGSSLIVSGGMTLNGSLTLQTVPGTFSTLNMVGGPQTLGGTGQVIFNGSVNDMIQGTDSLTVGPNITIRSGTQGGDIALEHNQGTISSRTTGQTINVSGNNWINTGILEARNGGILDIGGTLTTANLGSFTSNPGPNAGTVRLDGTLNNTGNTLNLSAATGPLVLANGTIRGGTVTGINNLSITGFSSTLDGVTVNTGLIFPTGSSLNAINGTVLNSSPTVLGSDLRATGGLIVNGTLTLQTVPGTFSTLDMGTGAQTLGGTGQVVFNGSANDMIRGTDTLTVGPNITIRSGTQGGDISLEVNQGTISSQTAGQTINVTGNNWTNSGILEARNGGTLNLGGTIVTANLGTLNSNPGPSAGTIRLTGTANNANSTLNLTGPLTLANGTIRGGTVAGGNLAITGGANTLDGVIVNTELAVPQGSSLSAINNTVLNTSPTLVGATLRATGGLIVNGILTLQTVPNNFSTLDMDTGIQTLGGTGQIVFNGSANDRIFGEDSLTVGPNITIRTGSRGGDIRLEHNQGTISSQTAGQTINLSGGGAGNTWTNSGILQAINGGTLTLSGLADIASVNVGAASLVVDTSPYANSGLINLDGGLILKSATLDTVRQHALAGRNAPAGGVANGKWNGTIGLASPVAAAAFTANNKENLSIGYALNSELLTQYTNFFGQPVAASDILVRVTRNGDANLDGIVNNNDITILAGFYRPGTLGRHWYQADFDYDGEVNNNDITILAGFYPPSAPPFTAQVSPLAAVPEPATAALFLLPAALLIRRRR